VELYAFCALLLFALAGGDLKGRYTLAAMLETMQQGQAEATHPSISGWIIYFISTIAVNREK